MRSRTLLAIGYVFSVLAVAAAMVAAFDAPAAAQDVPDVESLIADIDSDRLFDHVDAIDFRRSATQQPDAKRDAADYIAEQLASFGYPVVRDPVTSGQLTFDNIIGVHEGTMCPERILVVGAHYDSQVDTPGADDDASGVAGMLEMARVLADTPLPATVWFTGFTMEETGLVGAHHMAIMAYEAGTEVAGMYSLEMIGYTTPSEQFLAVIGNQASARLIDAYHRANGAYVPDLPSAVLRLENDGRDQPDSRRSDHAPFWDNGFQALLVTDTANFRNPNYHQPSDTIDTLDFVFMRRVTQAMTATTVDYLTYDGDADGEPDVCTGPLAATATPTPSPGAPATPPPVAPTAVVATPTPAEDVTALPSTGAGDGGAWVPRAAAMLAAAGALAAGGSMAWRRVRGRS